MRPTKLVAMVLSLLFLFISCGGGSDPTPSLEANLSSTEVLPFERLGVLVDQELKAGDDFSVYVDGVHVSTVGPDPGIAFLAPLDVGIHKAVLKLNGTQSEPLEFTVQSYQAPTNVSPEIIITGADSMMATVEEVFQSEVDNSVYSSEQEQAINDFTDALRDLLNDIDQSINDLSLEEYNLLIQLLDVHGVLGVLQELGINTPLMAPLAVAESLALNRNYYLFKADLLSFVLGNVKEGLKLSAIASVLAAPVTGGTSLAAAAVIHKLKIFVGLSSGLVDGFIPTDLFSVGLDSLSSVQCYIDDQIQLGFAGDFQTEKSFVETAIAALVLGSEIRVYEEFVTSEGDVYRVTITHLQTIVNEVAGVLETLGLTTVASSFEALFDARIRSNGIPIDLNLYEGSLTSFLYIIAPNLSSAVSNLLYELGLNLPAFYDAVYLSNPVVGGYDVANNTFYASNAGLTDVEPQLFRFQEKNVTILGLSLLSYYWPYHLSNYLSGEIDRYNVTVNTNILTELSIIGPTEVMDNTSTPFAAIAHWADGSTTNVTAIATWEEDSPYAAINGGVLIASAVPSNQQFTIRATYNSDGITESNTLAVTIVPLLAAPTGVNASDGTYTDRVSLTWNAIPSASGYNVYKAESLSGTFSLLTSVTGTSHDDYNSMVGGRLYYYQVTAQNGTTESLPSSYDSGYQWISIPAPTDVSASDGTSHDSVTITFNTVSEISGYKLYRSTSPNEGYISIKTLWFPSPPGPDTTMAFTDNSATAGVTYYYKVAAYSGIIETLSSYDSGSRADPNSLLAPTGVSASDGTDSYLVVITWNAVPGATGYRIYKATSYDGTYSTMLSTIGNTNCSGLDRNAVPGVTYYYKVKAHARYGTKWSAYSSYDSGYRAAGPYLPAPTGVSASDGTYTDRVRITWNAVPGASGYKVYRLNPSTGDYLHLTSVPDTYYDDYSATAGVSYDYRLRAYNGTTESSSSSYDSGYRETSVSDLAAIILSPVNGLNFSCGDSLNFQGSVTGGNPPYTYLWQVTVGSETTTLDTVEDPGSYPVCFPGETILITFTVTDSNGGSSTDSVTIYDTHTSSCGPAPAWYVLDHSSVYIRIAVTYGLTDAESWNIYKSNSQDGPFSIISTQPLAEWPYFDYDFVFGNTYYYRVSLNYPGCGEGDLNEIRSITPLLD